MNDNTFNTADKLTLYITALTDSAHNTDTEQGNILQNFLTEAKDYPHVLDFLAVSAKNTEDKSKKSRIAEVKAVWQAHNKGFETLVTAYHAHIAAARAFLKDKGILPNGNIRKTEAEKQKAAKNRFLAKALTDGLDVDEAVFAYELEQSKLEEVEHLVEDAVQALLTQYGHKLARDIAKAVLVATKDSESAPKGSSTI